MDLPGTDCFVVLSEGAVAGFAATRGDEFLHFGIAVDHWGSGLATLAHDDVLDHLRDRGIRRARLRVFTGNGRGRRFYEKHGWEPTGERSRSSFAPCPELLGYARPL
ncbi:GNAT family N-acetyltransferase [Terrabacter sp. Soil810]|uniref:GNAT family N-acetyltransferase n=1 Tax=Terrabacter sp. Soil810 TaxID=1736418 RepID=UPI001F2251A5|nr:GNAT family N-acetyltransferase [Terrabacter sp. Soil810]